MCLVTIPDLQQPHEDASYTSSTEPGGVRSEKPCFEVCRTPEPDEVIHAQQVELKLDRIDADSAYKWLLRKGRERDIMDFFMGKFYFPQYRNKSIHTIPNNQV